MILSLEQVVVQYKSMNTLYKNVIRGCSAETNNTRLQAFISGILGTQLKVLQYRIRQFA